jgi:hypothetical protein
MEIEMAKTLKRLDAIEASISRLQPTNIENLNQVLEEVRAQRDEAVELLQAVVEWFTVTDGRGAPTLQPIGLFVLLSDISKFITHNAPIVDCNTPIGTPVAVTEDDGSITQTHTRSKLWNLCGTQVVLLEGKVGGYRADRCRVLSDV